MPDLRWLNLALQARWPWLQRADRSKPWSEFKISVPSDSMAIFNAAARATVGNGRTTLFWEDRWINGFHVCELAPLVYGVKSARTVAEALLHDS